MMRNKKTAALAVLCAFIAFTIVINACKKDANPDQIYGLTPYNLVIPKGLPAMNIPATNPMTVEGVALGRKLFYDPILSGNRTMSCASCHSQSFGFTDSNARYSVGIDNIAGTRNSMPLINLGYQKKFFWDGGAADLESQVVGPIQNPIEMHENLSNALHKLNTDATYPAMFKKVFGGDSITTSMLMRAIAQFERTLISGNSKYDKYKRGELSLTAQEMNGLTLFEDAAKGDCTHCHSLGSTFSDFDFKCNGVDSIYSDPGRYKITLLGSDSGKFKTPSLRNIALTAPYMHDGRFNTLQECLTHYNTGFHYTANLDPVLVVIKKGRMSSQDMTDIIAFLNTLTDTEFANNPAFAKP